MLEGTNRNKTLEEVQSTPLDLQGVKIAIGQLADGESLFWTNKVYDTHSNQMVDLPFPPNAVINELQGFAREKQIDLYLP